MRERVKRIAKDLFSIWNQPAVALLPAHLAFFTVLSLVPILIIVFFGAQLFSLPIDRMSSFIQSALPDAVTTLLAPTEERAASLSVGIWLIIALFVGSNGTNSVMLGADALYGFDTHNPLAKRIKAMFLTLLLVILVLLGIAIIGLSEYLLTFIPHSFQGLIIVMRWILEALLAFSAVKFIYMTTPHHHIPSKYTNRGTIFTVAGGLIGSLLYTFYYANFGNHNELFGTLANLIVLMILIYILAIIFVFGLVINVYQYKRNAISVEKTTLNENDESLSHLRERPTSDSKPS